MSRYEDRVQYLGTRTCKSCVICWIDGGHGPNCGTLDQFPRKHR